jgi:hypothetical protein
MRSLLTVLAILCLAGSAGARSPVGCGSDCIGICFDEYGDAPCLNTLASPLTVYLLITDPTVTSGVAGWECHVERLEAGGTFELGWTLRGDAINISAAPDFAVGLGTPLLSGPAIVLASLDLLVVSDECTMYTVRAADDPSIPDVPVYAAGHDPGLLVPLNVGAARLAGEPLALNCYPCQVAAEPTAWGWLKAMYR